MRSGLGRPHGIAVETTGKGVGGDGGPPGRPTDVAG